jgi:hypothetical protein
VAVIESPTPAARRRRRWIVAGAVPLILVLALVGVLVADRLTGSTSENPPGAHRSGGDADGGGGSGLGDDGAQAGAGSSTTERGGGSGPDGTGTPGTTQNGGGGDLGDEPSMTRPGGDPPITLPPVVPTDPPSCPSMPTTASVDDASSSHGVRPTMASYELHPGKWMSLGREGAITGHLDDGSLEIRLFRNEVPGTQSSSEPVASGRADHYYMGPPLMLDGNGCWKESVKPFISYSCASGLDFRYHVAVVDKAEASRLAGISNSNGIDKDEIEGNPKMTFVGEFEVPTPYIPNCPALPG